MVRPGSQETSSKTGLIYTYQKSLGEGTFGQVWLAKNNEGRSVAIKVYFNVAVKHNESIYSELDVLQALSSSNEVCSKYATCLLDYYRIGRSIRIVMDYIDGHALSEYMRVLSLAERNNYSLIFHDLVMGMNAFHDLGIVHQDIKAANIMWDKEHKCFRYVDWGLGCLKKYCQPICEPVGNKGFGCGVSGTAYTMPPELEYGTYSKIDFETSKAHDYWSLGVVLLDWYTFPRGTSAGVYYVNDPPGNLFPYKLNSYGIKKRIAPITNDTVKKIIPLLLTHNVQSRLLNWNVVLTTAQDDTISSLAFNNVSQCNPPINSNTGKSWAQFIQEGGKLTELISIPGPISGQFWCFRKVDIIANLSYDPNTGSFTNPYTNQQLKIPTQDTISLYDDWVQYHHTLGQNQYVQQRNLYKSTVLQSETIETGAKQYLLNVLKLPELFSLCEKRWEDFYNLMTSGDGKYKYLLPFLWVLFKSNFNTGDNDKDQLSPIQGNKSFEMHQILIWRFIFDISSPVVTLASVFRLMEQWINHLLLTEGRIKDPSPNVMSIKRKLFCNYLDEFSQLIRNLELIKLCQMYLEDWNRIVNVWGDHKLENLMLAYLDALPWLKPFVFQWYTQSEPRIDELDLLVKQWIEHVTKSPDDKQMTRQCTKNES